MEVILELNEALDTATFYGVNNTNILCLKNQHPDVRVVARGYQVKVIGSQASIARFERNMRKCEAFCIKHNTLNEEQILQLLHGEQPTDFLQDNLILHDHSCRFCILYLALHSMKFQYAILSGTSY